MVKICDFKGVCEDHSYAQLECYFNFKYIDNLAYQYSGLRSYIKKHYPYYLCSGPIHKSAIWMGTLYRDKIDSGYIVDVSLGHVDHQVGYGLYAEQAIKKDSYIGEYVGLLCSRSRLFNNSDDYCFRYPTHWGSWKSLMIDSSDYGNLTRFINHGDKPNLETFYVIIDDIVHVCFLATRDIKFGEQLTFNYGNNYWHNRYRVDN